MNKTEIKLCQDIAKHWRKEINEGDWFYIVNQGHALVAMDESIQKSKSDNCIPLLTLEDCLKFLNEKIGTIELWRTGRTLKWYCRHSGKWWKGKTPLEACLRAVLAILKEEK